MRANHFAYFFFFAALLFLGAGFLFLNASDVSAHGLYCEDNPPCQAIYVLDTGSGNPAIECPKKTGLHAHPINEGIKCDGGPNFCDGGRVLNERFTCQQGTCKGSGIIDPHPCSWLPGCCEATCTDDCSASGDFRCLDTSNQQTCGQYDTDPCLDWGETTYCGNVTWCKGPDLYSSNTGCAGKACYDNADTFKPNDPACTCQDECSQTGQARCLDSQNKQTCGQYDDDACLEWGETTYCGGEPYCDKEKLCDPNKGCRSSACFNDPDTCVRSPLCEGCVDECSAAGTTLCIDSSTQGTCGQFDSDACLDLKDVFSCGNETYCSDTALCSTNTGCSAGACGDKPDTCQPDNPQCRVCNDECSIENSMRCLDSSTEQTCGQFDSDPCLEWGETTFCGTTSTYCSADGNVYKNFKGCALGSCYAAPPTLLIDCNTGGGFKHTGDGWYCVGNIRYYRDYACNEFTTKEEECPYTTRDPQPDCTPKLTAACTVTPSGVTNDDTLFVATSEAGVNPARGEIQMRKVPDDEAFKDNWMTLANTTDNLEFLATNNFKYQFRYQIWDDVNTASGWATCVELEGVKVDLQPPEVSCGTVPKGETTATKVTLFPQGSDAFSGIVEGHFRYRSAKVEMLEGSPKPVEQFGSWTDIAGSFVPGDSEPFATTAFTHYEFAYQAEDAAGNVSNWVSCGIVTMLQPGPSAECQLIPESFTNREQFTIITKEVDAAGVGLKTGESKYRETVKEGTFGPWVLFGDASFNDQTFTGTNGHTYQFEYRIQDNNNNWSAPDACGEARLDQTPPTASCTATVHDVTEIDVILEQDDDWSGINIVSASVDVRSSTDGGTTWSSWKTVRNLPDDFTYSASTSALYEFRYSLKDNAGNIGEATCQAETEGRGAILLRVWKVDVNGKPLFPINDAAVKLTNSSGTTVFRQQASRTMNSEDGWVLFDGVVPGSYGVLANLPGAEGYSKQADCTTNWTRTGATIGPNAVTDGLIAAWDNNVVVEEDKITTCQDLGLHTANFAPNISNLQVDLDLCNVPFLPRFNWAYSDPELDPQRGFQVKIDVGDPAKTGNPDGVFDIDSGFLGGRAITWVPSAGIPKNYGVNINWQVTAWDNGDPSRSDTEVARFTMPPHSYPQTNFSWNPLEPDSGQSVSFTDKTIYSDTKPALRKQQWAFADASFGFIETPNPAVKFFGSGIHFASLTATDGDDFTCAKTVPITVK